MARLRASSHRSHGASPSRALSLRFSEPASPLETSNKSLTDPTSKAEEFANHVQTAFRRGGNHALDKFLYTSETRDKTVVNVPCYSLEAHNWNCLQPAPPLTCQPLSVSTPSSPAKGKQPLTPVSVILSVTVDPAPLEDGTI